MDDNLLIPDETSIHPTAIIDPTSEIGAGVTVGPYAVIEGDVQIGDRSVIGPHAHIASGARLGVDAQVSHGASLGAPPQDLKFADERTELFVGDRTVVREFATLNRGTSATGRTTVGSDCMIMAYAHVAHDNTLGDHVILANAVQLGGHVTLGDWVIIGGGTVVHQFSVVGAHVMIGGGFRVTQDILPYVVVGGYPLKTLSLNRIGLERRGYSEDQIKSLSRIFRVVFRSRLNMTQVAARLREEMADIPEAVAIAEFIESTERGIVR